MAKLEARNLRISFRTNAGAVRAVRDISFNLEEGETLSIVGESGSGKSVTARAIMGILAGNAMVENGEIIYDGKDLLKISEEDFHTLRGHRLAMVFQDPLSALNPIMRIGKQLTEAMILNNRERRADGRARFNQTLKLLNKRMKEAGIDPVRVDANTKGFDDFVKISVKLENEYETAKEAVIETQDFIDDMLLNMATGEEKSVRDAVSGMRKAYKTSANVYLAHRDDALFEKICVMAKSYEDKDKEQFTQLLNAFSEKLKAVENAVQPDFFSIGYAVHSGAAVDPTTEPIESINKRCNDKLNNEFLGSFIEDIKLALKKSAEIASTNTQSALSTLKSVYPTFDKALPVKSECKAAAKTATEAVENAIDRLELEKDNVAYIFGTSIRTAINRYFEGIERNPKEEKRFARETVKHEKLVSKGRVAPAVVPMNKIDIETAHENMKGVVSELIGHYEQKLGDKTAADYDVHAKKMVEYLRDRASEYAYNLSKGMAKHRAIELMDEVGIPEPRKRYRQYPFEFSGGMRQRIVIAIALSANPDILICDEPTTALDVTIQAQILELINKLKEKRNLSVIFITHDLGVVANMADKIAVMYAGKIVEYGTADEVFYEPAHPYTWALLSSMPDLETKEKLEAIPGTPPNMILPPAGDAFAARNRYAMEIDFEQQPPVFEISPTHWAATWLLHPDAPKVEPPAIVLERIRRMKDKQYEGENA